MNLTSAATVVTAAVAAALILLVKGWHSRLDREQRDALTGLLVLLASIIIIVAFWCTVYVLWRPFL